MNRAERRRAEKQAKKDKVATYNLTQEQINQIKKEARDEAIDTAFTLMLAIPLEVLIGDGYWAKSAKRRLPKFLDDVLSLYDSWNKGVLTIEELREDLWNRGISHEIVRHRVASFAQESTRYCNYGKSGAVVFIKPCYLGYDTTPFDNWVDSCMRAERDYLDMLDNGYTQQEARAVLPTSLKTEVVMTANLREWRHFFSLRACGSTGKPHPQMLEVAVPLLKELREREYL